MTSFKLKEEETTFFNENIPLISPHKNNMNVSYSQSKLVNIIQRNHPNRFINLKKEIINDAQKNHQIHSSLNNSTISQKLNTKFKLVKPITYNQ
jgi:hypothetical protein